MILQVYSIYDVGVSAYHAPICLRSHGEATRMMKDSVADPNHLFAKHPSDYRIVHLGSFDDTTCEFHLLDHPQLVCTAEQVLNSMRTAQLDLEQVLQEEADSLQEEA